MAGEGGRGLVAGGVSPVGARVTVLRGSPQPGGGRRCETPPAEGGLCPQSPPPRPLSPGRLRGPEPARDGGGSSPQTWPIQRMEGSWSCLTPPPRHCPPGGHGDPIAVLPTK